MSFYKKYIFIAVAIFLNITLFQNCSCTKAKFSSSSEKSEAPQRGGNGEPTDGKPGSYYRWVDGYKCKGESTLVGEVHLGGNSTAKILDPETCELVAQPIAGSQVVASVLDSDTIGFNGGIYLRADQPVVPTAPPDKSYEAWCRGQNSAEILIQKSAQSGALTFAARLPGQNAVGPLSVTRYLGARTVEYTAGNMRLVMDRVASLTTNEVAGRIEVPGASPGQVNLSCRSGQLLDAYNHFAPVREFDFFGPALPAGFTLTRASTGSYYDTAGILRTAAANVPRFDYDFQNGVRKGLLVEKAASNLLINSGDLERWNLTGEITSANTAETLAPNGTNQAELFRNTNTVSNHQVMTRVTLSPGVFYTFSVFVKPAAAQPQRLVRLQILEEANFQNSTWVNFDLSTGQIDLIPGTSATDARQVSAGVERHANGWLRVWFSGVPSMTAGQSNLMQVFVESLDASTSVGVYADPAQSGYYLWGAQLEESETMSSYIPTGLASAARAADFVASNDLSWWDAGATEGSLMLDKNVPLSAVTPRASIMGVYSYFSLLAGVREAWSLLFERSTSQFTAQIGNAQRSSAMAPVPGIAAGARNGHLALRSVSAFNPTALAVTVNGANAQAANVTGVPAAPDRVVLSSDTLSGKSDHVQLLRYWPFRLEDPIRLQLSNGAVPR